MNKKIRHITVYICILAITFGTVNPAFAFEAPYRLSRSLDTIEESETIMLSIDDAVEFGLEHSTKILALDNAIDLARVTFHVADDNSDALLEAEELLEDGEQELKSVKKSLDQGQMAYDQALAMWVNDKTPIDIPIIDAEGNPSEISAGSNITDVLKELGYIEPVLSLTDEALLKEIKKELDKNLAEIDEGLVMYNEGYELLELKKEEMAMAIDEVSDKLDTKLNYSSVVTT